MTPIRKEIGSGVKKLFARGIEDGELRGRAPSLGNPPEPGTVGAKDHHAPPAPCSSAPGAGLTVSLNGRRDIADGVDGATRGVDLLQLTLHCECQEPTVRRPEARIV